MLMLETMNARKKIRTGFSDAFLEEIRSSSTIYAITKRMFKLISLAELGINCDWVPCIPAPSKMALVRVVNSRKGS